MDLKVDAKTKQAVDQCDEAMALVNVAMLALGNTAGLDDGALLDLQSVLGDALDKLRPIREALNKAIAS